MTSYGMPVEFSGTSEYTVTIKPGHTIDTLIQSLWVDMNWKRTGVDSNNIITIKKISHKQNVPPRQLRINTLVSNKTDAAVYTLSYADTVEDTGVVIRIQRIETPTQLQKGQFGTDDTLQHIQCKAISIVDLRSFRL